MPLLQGPDGLVHDLLADPAVRARYELALQRIHQRDPAGAVPLLQEVVRAAPEFAPAHEVYQDTALELGRLPEGKHIEDEMRASYATAPGSENSPLQLYLRARITADTGKQIEALNQALARDPGFFRAHLALGRLRRSLNQLEPAMSSQRAALSSNPRCAEASLELAELLVAAGRGREAEPHYQNYIRQEPSDRLARKQYAQLLIYELAQPTLARPIVEALRREDGGDVDVLMDLAAVEWKTSRAAQARELYKLVLETDRTQSRAALNLGNLWYEVLARGSREQKQVAWRKARMAYLYYLNMRRHDGVLDALDYHLGVPYRLERIAAEVGPHDGRVPALDDF